MAERAFFGGSDEGRSLGCAKRGLRTDLRCASLLWCVGLLVLGFIVHGPPALAQMRAVKLPSADKIISEYIKAIGGKKRVSAVVDALYEWASAGESVARVKVKRPAGVRFELERSGGRLIVAANERSAWLIDGDGDPQTLTDAEAKHARLQAVLIAQRFTDYKKSGIRAQTIGQELQGDEPAYVIKFVSGDGASVRCWFGARSKLLLKMAAEDDRLVYIFGDYRAQSGLLEPHRLEIKHADQTVGSFALRSLRRNVGIETALFDPPKAETFDLQKFLQEAERNQAELERRVSEYTFMLKETERELNERGEVKKETVRVYEVYPLLGPKKISVRKLISENGVPLSPERAAKEERRVAEEIARAEREKDKKDDRDEEEDFKVTDFFRICEMVSPRYEEFRGRRTLVFDFRPRVGYRPRNRIESVIARLGGTVWIDVADRQVARLEARLLRDFKVAGGLLASVRPGASVVFEQTRLPDGVWLPRLAEFNLAAKILFFAKIEMSNRLEYSDYKRFGTAVEGIKIESPRP